MEYDIYIDITTGKVKTTATGDARPLIRLKLLETLTLHAVFVDADGEVQDMELDSCKFAIKACGAYSSDPALVQDLTAVESGDGTISEKWTFELVIDSTALRAVLDAGTPDDAELPFVGEIQWVEADETEFHKTADLRVIIANAVIRPDDAVSVEVGMQQRLSDDGNHIEYSFDGGTTWTKKARLLNNA